MGSTSSTPARHRQVISVIQQQEPPTTPSRIAQGEEKKDEEGKHNDFDYSPGTKSTNRHVGLENRAGENNCFLNATIQALWHLNLFREMVLYDEQQQLPGADENIDLIFSAEDESTDTLGAIVSLFSQYQFTEEMCIPSTEIRCKLSDRQRRSICFLVHFLSLHSTPLPSTLLFLELFHFKYSLQNWTCYVTLSLPSSVLCLDILSQLDETGRFGIGDIADAAETLAALLAHIHTRHVSKLCAFSSASRDTSQGDDFCHTGTSGVVYNGTAVQLACFFQEQCVVFSLS
jgi:hypothetical protein